MKNYPHLYTPVNKKASFSNQIKTTQKKTTSTFGTQIQPYSKNPSSKTINPLNKPSIRRGNQTPRISSRSIEEMYLDRSSEDNYDMMERKKILLQEHRKMNQFYPPSHFKDMNYGHQNMMSNYQVDRYSVQSNEENQFFQQSYQKIGQIRFHVHNKSIDAQLNEVLQLIKQEKMRANQTVKTLKKAAQHYKKLCDNVTKSFTDSCMNTQQQLPYFKEVCTNDAQIQYQQEQKITTRNSSPTFAKVPQPVQQRPSTPQTIPETVDSPKKMESPTKEQEIIGKQKQIYTKLATMLQDMNINSKQILPEQIELNFQVKDYKNLSETQIIKIQKFFIKKLVEKIPK